MDGSCFLTDKPIPPSPPNFSRKGFAGKDAYLGIKANYVFLFKTKMRSLFSDLVLKINLGLSMFLSFRKIMECNKAQNIIFKRDRIRGVYKIRFVIRSILSFPVFNGHVSHSSRLHGFKKIKNSYIRVKLTVHLEKSAHRKKLYLWSIYISLVELSPRVRVCEKHPSTIPKVLGFYEESHPDYFIILLPLLIDKRYRRSVIPHRNSCAESFRDTVGIQYPGTTSSVSCCDKVLWIWRGAKVCSSLYYSKKQPS